MRSLVALALCLLAGCGSNQCTDTSECRLISNYCTCSCTATRSEAGPACTRLFCTNVPDLCVGRTAVCLQGICTVR